MYLCTTSGATLIAWHIVRKQTRFGTLSDLCEIYRCTVYRVAIELNRFKDTFEKILVDMNIFIT